MRDFIRLTAALAFGVLLWGGCSFSGSNEPDHGRVIDVPASQVKVVDSSQDTVAFDFEGALPVPCYDFEEALVDREGRTVRVKVRARSTADYCVTVTGTLRVAPLPVSIMGEGTYTFEFWRGNKEPIEIKVSVP